MSTGLASRIILVKGMVLVLLATVHTAVGLAFEPGSIAGSGTAELRRDYILYFCVSGVFFLFMGLVDLLCYRSLKEGTVLAWRISLMCSAFTVLIGAGGVSVFGVSPPLTLLVVGAMGVVALALAGGGRRHA